MEQDVSELLKNFPLKKINLEKAEFEIIRGGRNEIFIRATESGNLALIYSLIESHLFAFQNKQFDNEFPEKLNWKVTVEIDPIINENDEIIEPSLIKKTEEYAMKYGCIAFIIFAVISFFIGATELLSRLF